jgi:hypothetical protein
MAGELREFLLRVGGDRQQPDDLDGAVARALGDRSAGVVYGTGAAGDFFHADGSEAQTDERALVPVHYNGWVVAAIVHDPDSVVDDRLLDAVARVSALAVDHHRVVAVLRAALLDRQESAIALRQAQFRLVQAADTERRRIAMDLHDGVQQTSSCWACRCGACASAPTIPTGSGRPPTSYSRECRNCSATSAPWCTGSCRQR